MRFSTTWFGRSLFLLVVGVGLAYPGASGAQDVGSALRTSPKVIKAFKSVVSQPSRSAVRVRCAGKDVALGAVVSADGWIITKDSVLTEKDIVCRFRDGRELPARRVGANEAHDLALLKVDAKDLVPVAWRDSKETAAGKWVVTVGPTEDPVAIGVVSVGTRLFKLGDQPPNSGYLGVSLDDGKGGAKVTQVTKGTPAEKAGLKVNDIVTQVGTKKVTNLTSMMNAVQHYRPGEVVTIHLKRGTEELKVTATLIKRPASMVGNPQELMGSALSERRGGFPSILQHDTVVRPNDCGGPLIDLDGKALGINIARAGRTESYAIPAEVVRQLLPELMSGRSAPGAVAPAPPAPPPLPKKN